VARREASQQEPIISSHFTRNICYDAIIFTTFITTPKSTHQNIQRENWEKRTARIKNEHYFTIIIIIKNATTSTINGTRKAEIYTKKIPILKIRLLKIRQSILLDIKGAMITQIFGLKSILLFLISMSKCKSVKLFLFNF